MCAACFQRQNQLSKWTISAQREAVDLLLFNLGFLHFLENSIYASPYGDKGELCCALTQKLKFRPVTEDSFEMGEQCWNPEKLSGKGVFLKCAWNR